MTPDCYSYSNFIFRHLKKRDYTINACIGGKVSKSKLALYEKDVEKLKDEYEELSNVINALKAQRDFECLKGEAAHYVNLSKAREELEQVNAKRAELEELICVLEAGEYKELEAKEKLLAQNLKALQAESDENQRQINEKIRQHEKI